MRPDLDELLNAHASDKQNSHNYAPVYHALFKHLRNQPVALLEIGIGTLTPGTCSSMYGHNLPGYAPGASLRAWRDYFPHATIHGIDVQPDTMLLDDGRIITTIVDSTSAEAVETFLKNNPAGFDIIIDDGVHIPRFQVETLRNFYPALRPNGLYVIEDVEPHGSWACTSKYKSDFENIIGDALYFVVSARRADIVVISKRSAV